MSAFAHRTCQKWCCASFWAQALWDYTVHGILQVRILKWVAFPFARVSSQPRDWTQVSHIASRFFTSWATREACPLMRLAASKSCLSEHSLWVSQVTCRKSIYSETFMIFTSCNKFIKINKFSSLHNLMSLWDLECSCISTIYFFF